MDAESPWWQRSAWVLGPVAVALFMNMGIIVWLVGIIVAKGNIEEGLQKSMDANTVVVGRVSDDLKNHIAKTEINSASLLKAMRQICRNTAKDLAANSKCDDI
jgi:uncharacterized membrane-anchored protein YhcB (DUF1043 family)